MDTKNQLQLKQTTELQTELQAESPILGEWVSVLAQYRLHLLDSDKARRTVEAYIPWVKSFLSWATDEMRLSISPDSPSFMPRDLSAYRESLSSRGFAPQTINQALAAIKSFSHWQVEAGISPHHWAGKTKLIRVSRLPKLGLTRPQFHKIMRYIESGESSPRERTMMALLLGCGLRKEESVEVLSRDITLRASGQRASGIVWVRAGKGLASREVPFWGWVHTFLSEAKSSTPSDERVLPITTSGAYKLLHRMAGRCGVDGVYPHLLRRTYGQILRTKYPIETVKRYLGHTSLDVTAIYTEVPDGDMGEVPELW